MELKKLMEMLNLHDRLQNELLQVLERETAEMGDINISAMIASNQSKEILIGRIAEHSPALQLAIKELAAREGLTGTVSLGKLAENIAKRGNRELLIKQQQICGLAKRIQEVATMNGEIAERFVTSATTSLNLITRLVNQSNVYGASGGYMQRSAGAVMINREA